MPLLPLFNYYPILKETLPHLPLCQLPTPLRTLNSLADHLNLKKFFIKEDSLTSPLYGGNKVRKLEFLLAEALRQGCKRTITFGFAGSNHATATAAHAFATGLKSISILAHQENSATVRRNLLLSHKAGAELNLSSIEQMQKTANQRITYYEAVDNIKPYLIPAGGSSPLGTLGFLNALFELQQQCKELSLDLPDYIFAPLGTSGTVTGLLLGIAILKLPVTIVAVRVVDEAYMPLEKVKRHFYETKDFLETKINKKLNISFPADNFILDSSSIGKGYGIPTNSALNVMTLIRELEGIQLEQTYTAKTLAAIFDFSGKHKLINKRVLFWNTYTKETKLDNKDFLLSKKLPIDFQSYFQ